MPVIDIQSLMDDEHLQAVGMFEPHRHPSEGDTILVRPPVTLSASPAAIRTHAPLFGEHSRELARELGYDEAAVSALLASGALIAPS
jgi:crotonobetainyl-CoA:carnitine CoA-transferase CaiB-like acyl-CoA transferase